jgi:hypothetical protein
MGPDIGSALQMFSLPSERRHDQKPGNESSGQHFGRTRPSLAVDYTARADSQRFLTAGPAVLKQALALIAKKRWSPVPFQNCQPCSQTRELREGAHQCWRFLTRTRLLMRNRIDIDPKHSRAIVQEIGERLRAFLKEEPELPGTLRAQINRLHELEGQSPSIIPSAERWDKFHR